MTASESISTQTKTTYEDYKKLKSFIDLGYFLEDYVVSGGIATKNVTNNNYIDVTEIVASLGNDVTRREAASFKTAIASTTYYLDYMASGDFNWDTARYSGVYLPIAQVTTDANKNVLVITDMRGSIGGFRITMDTFTAWTTALTQMYDAFLIDVGGYDGADRLFGSEGLLSSITGTLNIPSDSELGQHATAISGYADTASTVTAAVGAFFRAQLLAAATIAFGANIVVQDKGFAGNLWGMEIDCNVSNVSTVVRGIDVTGGASVTPSLSFGVVVDPINPFVTPPRKWTNAFAVANGAAATGLEIGTLESSGASGSSPIRLRYRDAGGIVKYADILTDNSGNLTLKAPADAILLLQTESSGFPVNNVIALLGNKMGVMTTGLPAYTLDVNGDTRIAAKFAANGATPQAKQTVNAAATDAASALALVNQLRTALINVGICV